MKKMWKEIIETLSLRDCSVTEIVLGVMIVAEMSAMIYLAALLS